jgi:hypothetical protein
MTAANPSSKEREQRVKWKLSGSPLYRSNTMHLHNLQTAHKLFIYCVIGLTKYDYM